MFLEKFGDSRTYQLQRNLTNFIRATELTMDGIPHVAPVRSVASEVLFTCKDIVENNAVNYAGWGGLHEDTDTVLILFENCAQKLEGMSRQAQRESAIAEGNLLAASARLIRSLRCIMASWQKNIARAEQLSTMQMRGRGRSNPSANADTARFSEVTIKPAADGLEWPSDDFFLEWSSWPHFDALDLTSISGGI